ncbi:MAG: hypothetical protein JKY92_07965 [Magnetovibrio sp.]|nr:hypothetical protein [Magnetovibrio sp.]
MQTWIASISTMLFSANLLGGILSGLMFAASRKLERRPLKERIAFRLFCFSEGILVIFIFFYHVFMIELILPEHMIYWGSAMVMMPLLAIIGSEVMLVTFSGKMADKKEKLEQLKVQQRIDMREKRKLDASADSSMRPKPNPLRRQKT